MTPDGPEDKLRARQRSRSIVMAIALGAMVILFFAITIAKLSGNQ